MRRLRPRLFTIISTLSLALCILSIAIWRKSYTARSASTPTTESMRLTLTRRIRPMNLKNWNGTGYSLADSIEYIAYYTRDLHYEIDWPSLQAAHITKTTPVTNSLPSMSLPSMTLGDALATITSSLGSQVQFTSADHVIRISTLNPRTPPSGIQYIPPASIGDYVTVITHAVTRTQPPPQILPMYERVIGQTRLTLTADHGIFRIWLSPQDPASMYQSKLHSSPVSFSIPPVDKPGFLYHRDRAFDIFIFGLPFWLLTALTSILPLIWLLGALRRFRRRLENHCPNCAYDLRATPSLCPECSWIPQHP